MERGGRVREREGGREESVDPFRIWNSALTGLSSPLESEL